MSNELKRKILWNKICQYGGELLLDFVTYLGSIVTILSVYFHDKTLDPINIIHWIILVFSLFIFTVWVMKSIKKITSPNFLTLKKKEFFEYASSEKEEATIRYSPFTRPLNWKVKTNIFVFSSF